MKRSVTNSGFGLHAHSVSIRRLRVPLLGFAFGLGAAVMGGGCTSEGPTGPSGVAGPSGAACWDLDGNGEADGATEDTNGDGVVNVEDCHGADGLNALILVADDVDGVCAGGGKVVSTGVDDNRDGVLDPDEIDRTDFACFGGPAGVGGLNSLLAIVDEPPGSNCTHGGNRIESGLDESQDGILQPGEVTHVDYLCGTELTKASAEAAGANCLGGGVKLESGVDDDDSGTLEPGEVDAVSYLCHGANGANGLESLVTVTDEPPGANCLDGGSLIRSGADTNDNDVLDAAEVVSSAFVCDGEAGASGSNGSNGSNGLESLVRVDPEAPGPNCLSGGTAIFAGLDDNDNNNLEAGEIDSTSYVCQGAAGSAGATGSNAVMRLDIEPAGTNCLEGGVAIHVGLDLNANGTLDGGEATSTQYLCHGQDGTAYACDEGEIRYVVCGPGNAYEQRQVCDDVHNWIDVGSCTPPSTGGDGGDSCPSVALGTVELTDAAPAFTCHYRSTVVYGGEIWVLGEDEAHHSPDGINWTTEAVPYSSRCGHAAVVHAGKIFLVSGDQGSSNYAADVWSYQTGVGWNLEQGSLPFTAEWHSATSFGGFIYVTGGSHIATTMDDIWRSADGVTWTRSTGEAPFGQRQGHMITVWNGELWLSGYTVRDAWRSSNGTQWSQAAIDTGTPARWYGSMIPFDGRLWMMGSGTGSSSDDIWYSNDGVSWCLSHDHQDFLEASVSLPFGSSIYTMGASGNVFKTDLL